MNRLVPFFVLIACATAQETSGRLQFDWSKLAARASGKVDVNLESPLLEMASKFLSGEKGGDEAEIKQLVQGLKGIYVKSFTFDKEGQYSEADLAAIRSQVRAHRAMDRSFPMSGNSRATTSISTSARPAAVARSGTTRSSRARPR